eukprot:CAMPEP_0172065946 /NCGR_PEP_ID=MMETSP1043-20130122/10902_1 /TAXON_ID=464988 /ORGANISM="Hemiselmis andersenii, Strain CCMP441" /LENGTH=220 /DNA_ID=CAMNT_0012726079 /DNA_START=829 /DNA_END=1488 /DNA_ORIENTATION=-
MTNDGWPERPGGVDGAPIDREEEEVREKDCESDGNGGVPARRRELTNGRLPHDEAEEKGHDKLPEEYLDVCVPLACDVAAQVRSQVLVAGDHPSDDLSPQEGPKHLRYRVCEALVPGEGAPEDKRQCDGTIHLTTRMVPYSVREDENRHAEGEGDDDSVLAIARAVYYCAAAANNDKEGHGHELGEGCLEVEEPLLLVPVQELPLLRGLQAPRDACGKER